MGGGVILFIYALVFDNQVGEVFTQFKGVKDMSIISLMVVGVLTFVVGLIGLIGTCKDNRCCTTIYNLFNIGLAGVMLVIALFFIIYY
jgi:CD63 antigen